MTAKELFEKHFNGLYYDDITEERIERYAIEFAKLHVAKALKQASKKASIFKSSNSGSFLDARISNDSILTAYSLDDIV